MSSWFYLIRCSPDMRELPENFQPEAFASASEVLLFLKELDPAADFSEVGFSEHPWLRIHTDGNETEVPMPIDPVDHIGLRSPDPTLIRLLCKRFNCRVYDLASGMVEDPESYEL